MGPRIGAKLGMVADGSPLASVTKDATSGIYVPANATEWARVLSVAGVASGGPSSLWDCQAASGNLTDAIGSLTLTAGGTGLGYQQALTGWTRKAVSFTDAGSGHFTAAAASGPSPAATSVLWLAYVDLTAAPAATRDIISAGGAAAATQVCAQLLSTSKFRGKCLANPADGAANPITPGVIPVAVLYNRTAGTCIVVSDADKTLPTYGSGATDGAKGLGATQLTSAAMKIAYAVMFQGAAAELTASQLKQILVTLGFSISWT
jgi:hypothetical protein